MLLQKEVELCNFENASLRQKLSSVTKYIEELQNYMNTRLQTAIKLLSRPENGSCSLLLNDAELCSTDNIGGNQDDNSCSSLTAPKPMRIPLSHIDDEDSEDGRDIGMGTSTGLQILSIGIPASGSGESQESVPTSAVEKSSSLYLGLATSENDGQKLSEVDGAGSALNLSTIFGDNLSSSAQSSRSCSLSALSKTSPMQHGKVTRPCSDSVVPLHGHVTKRKKHTVGVSAVFDSDSLMEPFDNVLHDGLQGLKEQEATAAECLEVSQVGELVSLGAKSKIFGKIKAKEVKVVNKVGVKTKNRDSSRKSKVTFDNHNDDVAVVSESNKVSSGSKMKRPKPGDSSQLYSPGQPVPWASFNQKEEHSSKHSDKTTDCRTSSVVDQTPSKCMQTFLEKMRNLESQFQNPEAISNNKTQQDEMNHPSQCSNKTRGCRRTYVVVTDGLDHENDCAPSAHQNKKNTHWENEEDLGSLSPSPKSSSPMSKPSLHSFDTQPLADLQKENSSQKEITLGLNVKRLKSKRKMQELDRTHMLSEIDMQSLDINMQIHTQPEESETKKSHKGKAAKVAKGDTQEGCCRTRVDEFSHTAKSARLSKRTIKDLRATFLSMSQADTPTVLSLGSTASALPVSLDDEKSPLDSVFRSSDKIQKVQRPAIFQSSSSVIKTNSSSLERMCLGANGHLTDVKKKVDSVPKSSKRSTYTVSDVKELRVASNLALQHSEEGKNSQGDQARWSFLQVPSSRTQRDSLVVNVTEAPPHFDSLTKGPNVPDSSSKSMSKILPLDSCSSSSSPSRLSAAKDLVNPGRYSALPKVSAVFNKNYSKQMPSGRHEKKTIQANPQAILQNAAVQENENEVVKEPTDNEVLKDLTNVNSASCNSIPSEDTSTQPSRRRKKEVSYAEPKLNSKLRRGDPFTVTDFLSSPIYKTKSKKSVKSSRKPRKIKKIKVEETEPSSDFVINQ